MAGCTISRPYEIEGRGLDEIGEEEGQGSSEGDGRRMDHGGATVVDSLSEAYLVDCYALALRASSNSCHGEHSCSALLSQENRRFVLRTVSMQVFVKLKTQAFTGMIRFVMG